MLTRFGVLTAAVLTASVAMTAPDIAEPDTCTVSDLRTLADPDELTYSCPPEPIPPATD